MEKAPGSPTPLPRGQRVRRKRAVLPTRERTHPVSNKCSVFEIDRDLTESLAARAASRKDETTDWPSPNREILIKATMSALDPTSSTPLPKFIRYPLAVLHRLRFQARPALLSELNISRNLPEELFRDQTIESHPAHTSATDVTSEDEDGPNQGGVKLPFYRTERQPYNPPSSPKDNIQRLTRFARFVRNHSSPNDVRVTAGGRIVPVGPNSPPPTFQMEFLNNIINQPYLTQIEPTSIDQVVNSTQADAIRASIAAHHFNQATWKLQDGIIIPEGFILRSIKPDGSAVISTPENSDVSIACFNGKRTVLEKLPIGGLQSVQSVEPKESTVWDIPYDPAVGISSDFGDDSSPQENIEDDQKGSVLKDPSSSTLNPVASPPRTPVNSSQYKTPFENRSSYIPDFLKKQPSPSPRTIRTSWAQMRFEEIQKKKQREYELSIVEKYLALHSNDGTLSESQKANLTAQKGELIQIIDEHRKNILRYLAEEARDEIRQRASSEERLRMDNNRSPDWWDNPYKPTAIPRNNDENDEDDDENPSPAEKNPGQADENSGHGEDSSNGREENPNNGVGEDVNRNKNDTSCEQTAGDSGPNPKGKMQAVGKIRKRSKADKHLGPPDGYNFGWNPEVDFTKMPLRKEHMEYCNVLGFNDPTKPKMFCTTLLEAMKVIEDVRKRATKFGSTEPRMRNPDLQSEYDVRLAMIQQRPICLPKKIPLCEAEPRPWNWMDCSYNPWKGRDAEWNPTRYSRAPGQVQCDASPDVYTDERLLAIGYVPGPTSYNNPQVLGRTAQKINPVAPRFVSKPSTVGIVPQYSPFTDTRLNALNNSIVAKEASSQSHDTAPAGVPKATHVDYAQLRKITGKDDKSAMHKHLTRHNVQSVQNQQVVKDGQHAYPQQMMPNEQGTNQNAQAQHQPAVPVQRAGNENQRLYPQSTMPIQQGTNTITQAQYQAAMPSQVTLNAFPHTYQQAVICSQRAGSEMAVTPYLAPIPTQMGLNDAPRVYPENDVAAYRASMPNQMTIDVPRAYQQTSVHTQQARNEMAVPPYHPPLPGQMVVDNVPCMYQQTPMHTQWTRNEMAVAPYHLSLPSQMVVENVPHMYQQTPMHHQRAGPEVAPYHPSIPSQMAVNNVPHSYQQMSRHNHQVGNEIAPSYRSRLDEMTVENAAHAFQQPTMHDQRGMREGYVTANLPGSDNNRSAREVSHGYGPHNVVHNQQALSTAQFAPPNVSTYDPQAANGSYLYSGAAVQSGQAVGNDPRASHQSGGVRNTSRSWEGKPANQDRTSFGTQFRTVPSEKIGINDAEQPGIAHTRAPIFHPLLHVPPIEQENIPYPNRRSGLNAPLQVRGSIRNLFPETTFREAHAKLVPSSVGPARGLRHPPPNEATYFPQQWEIPEAPLRTPNEGKSVRMKKARGD